MTSPFSHPTFRGSVKSPFSRLIVVVILLGLTLSACGTVGGTNFVRAYAAGDRAYTSGRFEEAALAYEAAARAASRPRDREEALYSAAVSRQRGGNLERALVGFDALAAAKPIGERSLRAAFRAAHIRLDRGESKGALKSLAKLFETGPEHGVALRALGAVVSDVETQSGRPAALRYLVDLEPKFLKTRLGEEICNMIAKRREDLGLGLEAAKTYTACADRYPYPFGALWDDALFHAADIQERAGDAKQAVATLERMLAGREPSLLSGTYDRPRMPLAAFRIAEIYRDRLADPMAARLAFRRVYTVFPKTLSRHRARFAEAELAKSAGESEVACSLARQILTDAPESRWARRAGELCPAVEPQARALRDERSKRRGKISTAVDPVEDP